MRHRVVLNLYKSHSKPIAAYLLILNQCKSSDVRNSMRMLNLYLRKNFNVSNLVVVSIGKRVKQDYKHLQIYKITTSSNTIRNYKSKERLSIRTKNHTKR